MLGRIGLRAVGTIIVYENQLGTNKPVEEVARVTCAKTKRRRTDVSGGRVARSVRSAVLRIVRLRRRHLEQDALGVDGRHRQFAPVAQFVIDRLPYDWHLYVGNTFSMMLCTLVIVPALTLLSGFRLVA
jgi:hypothetical protein